MPVDLGPRFSPDFAGIPPHMSQNDLVLWEQFRRTIPDTYRGLFFDVALGTGQTPIPGTPLAIANAWRRLSRFRADLVVDTPGGWIIVEVRPNAGPGAIGALQVYTTLWRQDPPDARVVKPLLITDDCSDDIKAVSGLAGIEIRCLSELSPRPS